MEGGCVQLVESSYPKLSQVVPCFINLLLAAGSRHCPSLWAGTNGGTVYAFCLRVPPAERRMDEPVRAEQGEYVS